jgi:hypothetical protein
MRPGFPFRKRRGIPWPAGRASVFFEGREKAAAASDELANNLPANADLEEMAVHSAENGQAKRSRQELAMAADKGRKLCILADLRAWLAWWRARLRAAQESAKQPQ